jgi:ribose 1,5-bisphosphokinase
MGSGIAYVMGPSGVGKDPLLQGARASLAGEPILFAHRYITRPLHGGENFISLSEPEFELRRQHGLFAMQWQAHRTNYGIGREIELWQRAGCLVVVSGSREHFRARLASNPSVTPILITAPSDILAGRLRARGRDNAASIAERLARVSAFPISHPRLIEIRNDAALATATTRLVDALRALQ